MPDTFLFPDQARIQRRPFLLDATIRDFSGGWNTVDNDLNLDTKFSKILENMQRGIDGSNSVRPGTRLFADAEEFMDRIINCEYFNNFIVAVGNNGNIVKIDSNGRTTEIFNNDFGNSLPGSPGGWNNTDFASFAIFNGELIICNGINKPLIVNKALSVTFLQDLADNSNSNTPIAKYVLAHGRYLLMAGDIRTIGGEDTLYISATDISGTWVGDSSPNDAVNVSLGSRVPIGSEVIKGLGRFRDQLIVLFDEAVLPGGLGNFVDDVHVPQFTDAIDNVGALSHRTVKTIGEAMLFSDKSGISSLKRALVTGTVTSERTSQLIDPDYLTSIGKIGTSAITLENRTWALWDSQSNNFMLFIPNNTVLEDTTEVRCFVYKRNAPLKIAAWQDWRNWNFSSGCRTSLKRIFLTEGSQVFIMGEEGNDAIYKDYEGDQEMWSDNSPWEDYTGWNPVSNVNNSGIPIKFTWELPWSDNDHRFLTKASRYINFDTVGDNRFKVEMFTDNNYYNRVDRGEDWQEDTLKFDDDLGWDVSILDPSLSIELEGGDAPGFGFDEFGEDYSGGRPTRLEKLIAWTARYKIEKLRMSGDAIKELKFISITLAYLLGSLRR